LPVGDGQTCLPASLTQLDLHRLPDAPGPLQDQWHLPRWLDVVAPDLFLSPYPKGPWIAPCPVAVTIHDLLYLDPRFAPSARNPGVRWAKRGYAAVSARRAALVMTDSTFSKAEIQQQLGIDSAEVFPIGVEPLAAGGLDREGLQARYGIPAQGGYLLWIGNFQPHKNVPFLLDLWQGLAGDYPHHHLVLAGRGGERAAAIQRQIHERGIPRVVLTGSVEDADLVSLYRHAELFLFPSQIEGYGLPPLEAMVAGCPVMVSDRASLPEVVGKGGQVLPLRDEVWQEVVCQRLNSAPLQQKWRERGWARARQLGAGRCADMVLDRLEAI